MSGRVWTAVWTGERAAMAARDFGLISSVFRCGRGYALWRVIGDVITDIDPDNPRRAENRCEATLAPVECHEISPAYDVREVVMPQEAR